MTVEFREEFVEGGGSKVQVVTGGSGEPLLVLHGAEGTLGWMRLLTALAERFTVYLPSHPGYYQSERPAWLESIADMARFYLWFMDTLGLEGVRAVGHSLGGWLAADMAISCHHAFSKLLLVDAAGLKPAHAEVVDVFTTTPAERHELVFYDPRQVPEYAQLYGQPPTPEEQQVAARNLETALLMLRQPGYLHPPYLRGLVRGITIPTCIVWGRQDRIMPLECGELYQQAIPSATLVIIDRCGHRPYLEKPDEFVKVALDFLP